MREEYFIKPKMSLIWRPPTVVLTSPVKSYSPNPINVSYSVNVHFALHFASQIPRVLRITIARGRRRWF